MAAKTKTSLPKDDRIRIQFTPEALTYLMKAAEGRTVGETASEIMADHARFRADAVVALDQYEKALALVKEALVAAEQMRQLAEYWKTQAEAEKAESARRDRRIDFLFESHADVIRSMVDAGQLHDDYKPLEELDGEEVYSKLDAMVEDADIAWAERGLGRDEVPMNTVVGD